MEYAYLKALHIVFFVSWFAALFYMVRLFIYATDAQSKDEVARPILTHQLVTMQRRLWYIIGWPGMIGTFVFGTWMLIVFMNANLFFLCPHSLEILIHFTLIVRVKFWWNGFQQFYFFFFESQIFFKCLRDFFFIILGGLTFSLFIHILLTH